MITGIIHYMKDKIKRLQKLVRTGAKFSVLTAYDATIARVLDEQEIEVILVGDSLGMVVHGQDSTSLVTLAEMESHTIMVRRGVKSALLMSDIPMACGYDTRVAMESALCLMRAGADMVKFEADEAMLPTLRELSRQGLPFCAHIGLRPQQALKEGGYKIKGRDDAQRKTLLSLAKSAEDAGADMLLIECVVSDLAKEITDNVQIPVVGIGSGAGTDAQVLVIYDLLGLNPKPATFVRNFMQESSSIAEAVQLFRQETLNGNYPNSEQSYT